MFKRRYENREPKAEFNIEAWQPRTKLGQMVKEKKIASIEQIFSLGKPIKEVEIVDALLPALESKVLETASVQRMTKDTRKQKYRTTVVIGDKAGHVGVGVGKTGEVKASIEDAIKDAKKKVIHISFGCGSWECSCRTAHSLPIALRAKCGTAQMILKPAPRGVGIVAGKTARTVLEFSGVKDVWVFSRGRTRDIFNTAMATYLALKSLSRMKNTQGMES